MASVPEMFRTEQAGVSDIHRRVSAGDIDFEWDRSLPVEGGTGCVFRLSSRMSRMTLVASRNSALSRDTPAL